MVQGYEFRNLLNLLKKTVIEKYAADEFKA